MSEVRALKVALEMYHIDKGEYPGEPNYYYCNSGESTCNSTIYKPFSDLGLSEYVDPSVVSYSTTGNYHYYVKGGTTPGLTCRPNTNTYALYIAFETKGAGDNIGTFTWQNGNGGYQYCIFGED